MKSYIKVLIGAPILLAVAACSGYTEAGYNQDGLYGADLYGAGYGADFSGGDIYGVGTYAAASGGQTACASAYEGTPNGLRGSRYGTAYPAGYSTGGQKVIKSRYGASIPGACQTGYWVTPVYQVQTQTIETVQHVEETPIPAPAPIIVQAACPAGQYRAHNGDCAILITEEPEPYVPPQSYPTQPLPIISYTLPRK